MDFETARLDGDKSGNCRRHLMLTCRVGGVLQPKAAEVSFAIRSVPVVGHRTADALQCSWLV